MDAHSHRMERVLIFAADNEGRIPVPTFEKRGLQAIRKTLARLKKKGLVREDEGPHSGCSPFVLTDHGKRCREFMISGKIQNEVDSMNWSREEPPSLPSGLL